MSTYGDGINNEIITTMCHCGEKGVTISLPVNPPQGQTINLNNGFTLSVKVAPYNMQTGRPAAPAATYAAPYVVPSADGQSALWTLQGTEFPPPTGGVFIVEIHADSSTQSLKDWVLVRVRDAW